MSVELAACPSMSWAAEISWEVCARKMLEDQFTTGVITTCETAQSEAVAARQATIGEKG